MSNDLVFIKGTLFVAPGGGGAPTPLEPGPNGYTLVLDDTEALGMNWQAAVPGDGDVTGPGSAVSGNFASFSGTTGKLIADSGKSSSSFLPALVTGGAASTRGSFTFNGSGTHTQIATTAIASTSVVLYTITTVAGASSPQAISTAIQDGVGFTPTSADASDASVVNWVII